MKNVTIHTVWHASTTVEVPDDWEMPGNLSDFGADVDGNPIVDMLDTAGAELVDWH